MTTIKQKQEMVLRYIGYYPQTPLVFKYHPISKPGALTSVPEIIEFPITESMSLKALVYAILEKCVGYDSYTVTSMRYETSSGRMRSSLDIWRHVKYYRPDVDIFSVMEALYQLRDKMYGHYCVTVCRAVFKLPSPWISFSYTFHPGSFFTREYGTLTYAGWKKLHYKGEKRYE